MTQFNDILLHDFAQSLRHVIFAWTVEHPKLFSSEVDPAFLRSHHLEKEKIETIVQATKQFMHVFLHETMSEAVLNPGQGGGGAAAAAKLADDTRWKDPRAGWQGVLLGLLEGLCVSARSRFLVHRCVCVRRSLFGVEPEPPRDSQSGVGAQLAKRPLCLYAIRPTDQVSGPARHDADQVVESPHADRDYIGVELVEGLVNIVFPSQTGKPTGPGDPIKDYKGHPVLAPEIKFAALDVLVESLRRQVATASALRKLLPLSVSPSLSRARSC